MALRKSVPDEEQAAYRSAPLYWLDFPAIHRVLCPLDQRGATTTGSLPERLARATWVRWDGTKTVSAESGDSNATRSVPVTDADRCEAHLSEKRDNNQVQVNLTYRIDPSQRF